MSRRSSTEFSCRGETDNVCTEKKIYSSKYCKFFDISDENAVRSAVCKTCNNGQKIKMHGRSTTYVKAHLQKCHPNLWEHFSSCQKVDLQPEPKKIRLDDQESFKLSIVKWLSIKKLPLSFFDDPATQEFLYGISNFRFPKRTTMKNYVDDIYVMAKERVQEILKSAESKVSLTVDGWTSVQRKSYYGITAHFLDNDWILRSLVLDFVPSNGHHTGKEIAEIVFRSFQEMGLLNKIIGITTDNAAANSNMMSELQKKLKGEGIDFDAKNQHFRCVAHILHLVVKAFMKNINYSIPEDEEEEEKEEEEEEENSSNGNNSKNNNYNHHNDDDIDDDDRRDHDDDDDGEELSQQSSYEIYEEAEHEWQAIEKIRNFFKKIRSTEKMIKELKRLCKDNEEGFLEPSLDVATRFNSTYDMINTANKMKNSINEMQESSEMFKKYRMSLADWEVIEFMTGFLKIFKSFTELLSGQKYPTISLVIICMNNIIDIMEKEIEKLNLKKWSTYSISKNALRNGLQAGMDKLLKYYRLINWIYCSVLVLDPRHKLSGFEMKTWGKELKSTTLKKFKSILKTYDVSEKSMPKEYPDSAFDDILGGIFLPSSPKTGAQEEFERYCNFSTERRDVDILNWWKNHTKEFPTLSRMARDFLVIQATSVPSERLFSTAGLIIRKERSALLPASANKLLSLNSWFRDILKDLKY